MKQTRGHAFLQGVVKQDGEPCYSFSGTLKRVRRTQRAGDERTGRPRLCELIAGGELKPDPAQERAVAALDRLAEGMATAPASSRGCSANARTGPPESICGAASGAANRC